VAEPSPSGATTVELAPVGAVEVTATLTATPKAWGTALEWSCAYPPVPPGEAGSYDGDVTPPVYELVLVGRDGERTVAATWTASGTAASGLGAASSLRLVDVASAEIRLAGGDALAAAAL
jgi:hypothetical protein